MIRLDDTTNALMWSPETCQAMSHISATSVRRMVKLSEKHGGDCECKKCVAGWVSPNGKKILVNPLAFLTKILRYPEADAWRVFVGLGGPAESSVSSSSERLNGDVSTPLQTSRGSLSGTASRTCEDPCTGRPPVPLASQPAETNRGRCNGSGMSPRPRDAALDRFATLCDEADQGGRRE